MVRKLVAVCVLTLVATVGGFAQVDIDLDEIDPALIDPQQVDLSEAQFSFSGPVELLISGVRHEGMRYSAVLEYDGGTTVTIKQPPRVSPDMLPASIDLSNIGIALTEEGVRLHNVVVDGDSYSGIVAPGRQPTELIVDAAWLEQRDVVPSPERLAELERTVAEQRQEIIDLRTAVDDPEERIAQLEGTIEEKEAEIDELEGTLSDRDSEIAQLERRLRDAREPAWRTALEELTRVRVDGFDRGSAALGSWRTTRTGIEQTDSGQLFAKYEIPVRQNASEMLYTFEGRATGSGRQGFGLHFLASDVERSDLWGYGTSYLVWITQDPAVYQTDDMFVQLYASSSDVDMVNVVSQKVPADVTSLSEVQVYADRNNGEITVSVDGDHVFTYSDPDFIRSGAGVALRTLGSASFESLQVRE